MSGIRSISDLVQSMASDQPSLQNKPSGSSMIAVFGCVAIGFFTGLLGFTAGHYHGKNSAYRKAREEMVPAAIIVTPSRVYGADGSMQEGNLAALVMLQSSDQTYHLELRGPGAYPQIFMHDQASESAWQKAAELANQRIASSDNHLF